MPSADCPQSWWQSAAAAAESPEGRLTFAFIVKAKPPPGQAGAGAGDRFVPAAQLARTGAALGAPAADFCFCSRHGNRSVKTRKPSPASSRAKPMTIANFATFSAK
jgi:hypothetical protein